jgi:hypothetical protein
LLGLKSGLEFYRAEVAKGNYLIGSALICTEMEGVLNGAVESVQ